MILVSFTGNDICSVRNLTPDGRALSEEGLRKSDEVRDTLVRELRSGIERNSAEGARIVILGAAAVLELLTNPSILNHETPVAGKDEAGRGRTCRELRTGAFPLLNQMCPLILNTRPEDRAKLALIGELYAAVVAGQKAAVDVLRAEFAARGVTLEFNDSFRDVKFAEGDVSDDCFHPSAEGHRRLFEMLKLDY